MPARVRIAAAIVVAVGGARRDGRARRAHPRRRERRRASARSRTTSPAAAPFAEFDEARVAVGDRVPARARRVDAERSASQGLRDVQSLAPYDGMLFVYPSDTDARFTMADTPMPLDITFFAADGAPVDTPR